MSRGSFEATTGELDGGVRVVAVRGELDLSTAPELEEPLREAVASGNRVLLDLSECEFIDSTGIAMIVRAWQQLSADDGEQPKLAICSANEQVRRVLEITGLELSIPVQDSREQALAGLRAG